MIWSPALGQPVVASELSRRNVGGKSRETRDATPLRRTMLSMLMLAAGLGFSHASHATAGGLSLPAGALLDINNGTAANSASNVANQFQTYSVSYTATSDGANYVLFAFRQDPAYWTFGNVILTAAGSSTNLFVDPTFTQGGTFSQQSGLQAPAGWGIVYQSGSTPTAAGRWVAPGSGHASSTTNVNQGTAGAWYDGAVGSFDGIYQGVSLVAGTTYTITFTALSNNLAGSNNGVELGVFAGNCLALTGSASSCVPDNAYFEVLATPSQTTNAGGPSSTVINVPVTVTTLGSALGVFDGGVLTGDRSATLSQNFTVSGHGGTVDEAGHDLVIGGVVSDAQSGTPGALTVTNSGQGGSLTLTGANTYTGTTTIDSGSTLALAGAGSIASSAGVVDNGLFDISQASGNVAITTLSGGGVVALGSQGLTLTAAAGDFGGSIQGTGGVTVASGTEVFSGDNTYSGGTHLNGGSLQISRDSNLGDASGAVTFNGGDLTATQSMSTQRAMTIGAGNGSLTTQAGVTLAAQGDIGGTGGLVKNGAGTLVLSGDNSYAGGTTLNGGSVQISRDGNLGDASGAVTFNGGDLTATQSMSTQRAMTIGAGNGSLTTQAGVTLAAQGNIGGTGALIKNGTGTLVLTGNNTYSGGSVINGGAVQINSGSALGTGTLALNSATLQTMANLTLNQPLLLSGTAGMNIAAGTTTVLSGSIQGSKTTGCFTKDGKGTLNLTGAATLNAGTCVAEGILRANGTLNSQVQVYQQGVLRGVGQVNGAITVNGTLAPGNSPGTLTVSGPVVMNAGSSLQIDIDGYGTGTGAGNYSRLLLVGANSSFTAGGTLVPVLRGITGNASNTFTPVVGDQFVVVSAQGGVQGQFTGLQQPTAGLAPNTRLRMFVLNGNQVNLYVTPASYASLLTGQVDGNALRTAAAVDRMGSAMDSASASAAQQVLLYGLSGAKSGQLAALMSNLSGEVHAQQAAMAREASLGLAGDIGDHLAESQVGDGTHANRAWATLSQGGYRTVTDADAQGFRSQQSRMSVGLDAYRSDAIVWGVGLAHTEANLVDAADSATVRGNALMVYSEVKAGPALLDGSATWSKDDWNSHRPDPLASGSLYGDANGHSMAASLTARFPLALAGGRFEPYAQAIWQRVSRDGFAENGDAVTQLQLGSYRANGTRVLAGVKFGSAIQDALAADVTYRVGVAAGADMGDTLKPTLDATLAGENYTLNAPSMGRALVKLDASGTMRLSKQAYLYGGLSSETGRDRSSYSVNAGVRVQF